MGAVGPSSSRISADRTTSSGLSFLNTQANLSGRATRVTYSPFVVRRRRTAPSLSHPDGAAT